MVKKYEVCTIVVNTHTGKDALNTLLNSTNQTPYTVKSFDSHEEAKSYYDTISTSVKYIGRGMYEHVCKYLEENEYDEDSEWIGGGDWWESNFPDMAEPAEG